MRLYKRGGWKIGSVSERAFSYFRGDVVFLFIMPTRDGGGRGYSVVGGGGGEKGSWYKNWGTKINIGFKKIDKVDTTYWYVKKYYTPVMFARFFCALLGFCAPKVPAKYGKTLGHFLLTVWQGIAQDAPCFYTWSHLSELPSCNSIILTNFCFILYI